MSIFVALRTTLLLTLLFANLSNSCAFCAAPPYAVSLLRVRGGQTQNTTPLLAITAAASSVPTPSLLEDAIAEGNADATAPAAARPDAIHVFASVLKYVWPANDLRARALVIFSLIALTTSKLLNVVVPFTLKRARCQRAFAADLFRKLHALDASWHAEQPTGLLAGAFARGVRGFANLLSLLLYSVLPTFLELGLSMAVLAKRFSPQLALVTFGTFVAYIGWTAAVVELRIRLRKRLTRLDNAKGAYLVDSIAGTEAVKVVGNEKVESDRFDAFLRRIATASVSSVELGALLNFGQAAIFSTGLLGALLISARRLASGALSIGDVVAVNSLLLQLARPLDFIGYTVAEIRRSLVEMDAMLRVMSRPTPAAADDDKDADDTDGEAATTAAADASAAATTPATTPATAAAAALEESGASSAAAAAAVPTVPPEVRFDRVTFRYSPTDAAPCLTDVSFTAPAGGVTALVGPSGSGKSTCLRLLARLNDAEAGHVTLWGRDVRSLSPSAVRSRLGFIAQTPAVFDDTLRWNVQLGDLGASKARLDAAIDAAALAPTIAGLPLGVETRVGERGSRLSGGERQRVEIARALLRDAPLLLADEPTSSADAVTAAALVDSLRRRAKGATRIVVTHRLAAITPAADHVVVFEGGRVVEQGTHAELLRAPTGVYRRLWITQGLEEDGEDGEEEKGAA